MKVEIEKDKFVRIENYVKDGRFKTVNEFVDKALTLLLYAEDNRDKFAQMIRQQKDE